MIFTKPFGKSISSHMQARHIFSLPLLLLAVPCACFCLSPAAKAQGDVAHLVVGGKEAPFEVPPFIGQDGQVYAPADFVRLLGADYELDPQHQDLTITAADGKQFEQAYRVADQRFMIPVESVASQLGAVVRWDAAQHTMSLRARIQMVREDHNTLTIATSYPVYYRVDSLADPARLYVDVFGATLPAAPASIPVRGDNLLRIRSGQAGNDTVRLVLDLRHAIHYEVAATMQTSNIQVALNTDRTSTAYVPLSGQLSHTPAESGQSGAGDDTASSAIQPNTAPQIDQQSASTGDFKITDIEFKNDAGSSQVVITTQGTPPGGTAAYRAFLLDDPERLAFDLPGAGLALTGDLANNTDAKLPVASPDISDIRWGSVDAENGTLGRIVIDLAHTVAYNVSTQTTDSGDVYIIDINPPAAPATTPVAGAGGSLAGKIVCIDPGHGGKDTGAPGIGGLFEKNIALAIGKQLSAILTADGAHVVMTRDDDTFIPLTTRSQIGIDAHADCYVSIHCDSSSSGRNSAEGSTVWYHANNSASRDLARSVSARLAQLSDGIRTDGIRSDFVRYPGIGFSVLRHSTEPAVLVENGYMNSDVDIKELANTDVQHKIAEGIAAGIRDFLQYRVADNP